MSIRIKKQGIRDAFYDEGRYGYRHLGINPGGVMDTTALNIANALTLNRWNEAVLEMHFPAPEIEFKQDTLFALSGADFSASVNGSSIAINRSVWVKKGTVLSFLKPVWGLRTYLSVRGGFMLEKWLGSYSTNLDCCKGGFNGRLLKTGDVIGLNRTNEDYIAPTKKQWYIFPFSASTAGLYRLGYVRLIAGPHFNQLNSKTKDDFANTAFTILNNSNRMGYRLQSDALAITKDISLISTGVTIGTVQLLPSGQLIVLMADHQTTGGYPIIGNVISADLSTLAQCKPSQKIQFILTDLSAAHNALYLQQRHLLQVQNACTFQLKDLQ